MAHGYRQAGRTSRPVSMPRPGSTDVGEDASCGMTMRSDEGAASVIAAVSNARGLPCRAVPSVLRPRSTGPAGPDPAQEMQDGGRVTTATTSTARASSIAPAGCWRRPRPGTGPRSHPALQDASSAVVRGGPLTAADGASAELICAASLTTTLLVVRASQRWPH